MGNRRDRKKAMKRAEREWIPGVPALHAGGNVIHQLTEHGNIFGETASPSNPLGTGALNNPPPPGPESPRDRLLREGFVELVPGEFFNFTTGESINLNRPAPGGTGASARPQFRAGELDFLREQFAFEQESFQLDLELRREQEKNRDAVARGNLALARQTEARIAQIQRRQQQLEAALGRAQGIAGLASSRGNIEAQRAQFLSNLAANPRDFRQLNIGLGGGQSFLGNLLTGQQVGGQSTSLIGETPTLGADFQRLLQSITARPDIPLFEEALEGFRNVPQFRKGGTHMVTDEPILGIGLLSGMPKFTLGEPAPGFPLGKSEDVDFSADGMRMKVTPMQAGGSVTFQDIANDLAAGKIPLPGQPQAPKPVPQVHGLPPINLPDFPGLGALIPFLGIGDQLSGALEEFSFGTAIPRFGRARERFEELRPSRPGEAIGNLLRLIGPGAGGASLGRRVREITGSIPRTPGEAIRRLMEGLAPQQFFNLLPSQTGLLESVVSALGVPPQDFFSSLTRSFPTGPDPSRISFGNFLEGGTVTIRPQAPGGFFSYLSAA